MDQCALDSIGEKYDTYGIMLYRLCMIYLKNRHDAEDAVQDTFYKFMCSRPKFNDSLHEKRWLICVAKNTCKNMIKSKNRNNVMYNDNIMMTDKTGERSEILNLVYALPIKYKEIVVLYYFEMNSVEEIASLLKISVSAAKMRLKRAREKLKVDMEDS